MKTRSRPARRVLVLFTLIGLAGVFASCNTWRGMGRDLEKAGEAMQGAADGK